MVETRGNEERRKRSRDHKDHVAPYLHKYESVEDGWTVSDGDGRREHFSKDERERAEEYAQFVYDTWDGPEEEASEAGESVD